jgi:hypothetical protein
MTQASRILPLGILPGAVGLIAAAGNVGCAILPWGTGTLMERWGVGVCAPLWVIVLQSWYQWIVDEFEQHSKYYGSHHHSMGFGAHHTLDFYI